MKNNIMRVIGGVLFVDRKAVADSINGSSHPLQEAMINTGVLFWDQSRTIVKRPTVAVSATGSFPVCLANELPSDTIQLHMGPEFSKPISLANLVSQSSDVLSIDVFGVSLRAELEFASQSDKILVKRNDVMTSAKQNEAILVALTESGARMGLQIQKTTTAIVSHFANAGKVLADSEELSALYPLNKAISLTISAPLETYKELMQQITDNGKEIEYRNILALMNDQLHQLYPSFFKKTAEYQHTYPQHWQHESALEFTPALTTESFESKNISITKNTASPYVKMINGILFIDAEALDASVPATVPAKDRLRQKMIHAGVVFWDAENTIVQTPVIAITTVGGFLVKLTDDLKPDEIKLNVGEQSVRLNAKDIVEAMKKTMGLQSTHTYMNPNAKSLTELYELTTKYNHYSFAHAETIGFMVLGLSKQAECEFDYQRGLLHLARETSARHACQDQPAFVAMSETGVEIGSAILKATEKVRAGAASSIKKLDDREEVNAFWPCGTAVSFGINATLRNYQKLFGTSGSAEYMRVLRAIHQPLSYWFPELFKPLAPLLSSKSANTPNLLLFPPQAKQSKPAILLLGAPGVGKSTQTSRIMQQLPNLMCISTGNLLRKALAKIKAGQPLNAAEDALAKTNTLGNMAAGGLVDDDAVYALLMAYLSPGGEGYEEYCKASLIILDGVIKADRNLGPFERALNKFNQQSTMPMYLTKVVNIEAPDDNLIARQQARVDASLKKGEPQRPDDNVETYKLRLQNYNSSMQPVIDHYRATNIFLPVDSTDKTIEQTTAALLAAINTQPVLQQTLTLKK